MADHIPFVNGKTDCELVSRFYSDSAIARVPLEKAGKLIRELPDGMPIWLDPGVDGFNKPYEEARSVGWKEHVRQFTGFIKIGDPEFQKRPDVGTVDSFVSAILSECASYSPKAITVPQLPHADDASRNKINRALATATAKWRSEKGFGGRLILPAILTGQRQLNKKTERNKKRDAIMKCYRQSEAQGLWAVDASLKDQDGSETFRNVRFPGLVAFHEEIAEALPEGSTPIAGPYWGMNLVLWAKGLCRYPAIGLGGSYQYHIPGGQQRRAVVRLAIPPLRRWARTGAQFRTWLDKAIARIPKEDAARGELVGIRDNFSTLDNDKASRRQIAKFYKDWFDKIEASSSVERALTLYQMLSAAYILGKKLPSLPAIEKTARHPERVAEYLMLNCL